MVEAQIIITLICVIWCLSTGDIQHEHEQAGFTWTVSTNAHQTPIAMLLSTNVQQPATSVWHSVQQYKCQEQPTENVLKVHERTYDQTGCTSELS